MSEEFKPLDVEEYAKYAVLLSDEERFALGMDLMTQLADSQAAAAALAATINGKIPYVGRLDKEKARELAQELKRAVQLNEDIRARLSVLTVIEEDRMKEQE